MKKFAKESQNATVVLLFFFSIIRWGMAMTYVEFFDKPFIENICVSLIKIPDRIVLVGGDKNVLEKHKERYEKLFIARGHRVEFVLKGVNKNNLNNIVECLSDIVMAYDDLAFDLTGGGELYLTAMGIVFERYKDKNIQMHKYNIKSSRLIDCDADGNTVDTGALPMLSVKENISLYGGSVMHYDAGLSDCSDEEFTGVIDTMWEICKKNPKAWNTRVSFFEYLLALPYTQKQELSFEVDIKRALLSTRKTLDNKFLSSLMAKGLITYELTDKLLRVNFKNQTVRRCLSKSGQLLEFRVLITAVSAVDKKGQPIYTDALSGVFIDWDGEKKENVPNTENEVDIILMRGAVPVFISCKNGYTDADELYKLHTVAENFGGSYSVKSLIAGSPSELSNGAKHRGIDMGLKIIDCVHTLSEEELVRRLSELWIS